MKYNSRVSCEAEVIENKAYCVKYSPGATAPREIKYKGEINGY